MEAIGETLRTDQELRAAQRPAPRPRALPGDAALRGVGRVLAIRAGGDPEVRNFRQSILGGRLVTDAARWIERQATRPGALRPEGLDSPGNVLAYRTADGGIAALPVRWDVGLPELPRAGRALAWLEVIARRLGPAWGIEPADIVQTILTGAPVELRSATATIEHHTPAALSFIRLRVHPSVTPDELAAFYAGLRHEARRGHLGVDQRKTRPKPVEAWKADLVAHVEATNDGQTTWEESMTRWNREHATKRFAVPARYRRVAIEAVRRVLGEELIWKNPKGAPGQRRRRKG
jgi:hypothetical protein